VDGFDCIRFYDEMENISTNTKVFLV